MRAMGGRIGGSAGGRGRRAGAGRAAGRLGGQAGTTLVELLIGVVIVGMILVAMVTLWRETQLAYVQGSAAADLQGDVRAALDQITHDLRRAGRNVTNCVFAVFPAGTATGLQLQRDLDNAGCVSGSEEIVTFAYNSGTRVLTRNGTTLARNIDAPGGVIFTYWHLPVNGVNCQTGALASTTAPSAAQLGCTRRIAVTLRGSVNTPTGTLVRTVRSDVDLRSR